MNTRLSYDTMWGPPKRTRASNPVRPMPRMRPVHSSRGYLTFASVMVHVVGALGLLGCIGFAFVRTGDYGSFLDQHEYFWYWMGTALTWITGTAVVGSVLGWMRERAL